ncbi:MAG TPA: Fur family transcriptional regulator [Spirochaetota bacterium]|nr:Fur family transcriptional regulator [Spirochaetota bacterium]
MDKCDAKSLLTKNNLKLTKQRIILLETIIDSEKVFSAASLEEKVKKNMDLVTIYRIISVFLENKIIREVFSNDAVRFYELSCEHNPLHPHFFCKKCGKLYCLNSIDKKHFSNLIALYPDYSIEEFSLQFSGVCSKCK